MSRRRGGRNRSHAPQGTTRNIDPTQLLAADPGSPEANPAARADVAAPPAGLEALPAATPPAPPRLEREPRPEGRGPREPRSDRPPRGDGPPRGERRGGRPRDGRGQYEKEHVMQGRDPSQEELEQGEVITRWSEKTAVVPPKITLEEYLAGLDERIAGSPWQDPRARRN
ncbi:MAG: hypothetical protein ACYDAY_09985 [Candidatus Dormibacteria bacterium]